MQDGLPDIYEANIQRKKNLKEKYESVLMDSKNLQESGIRTFGDLIARYQDLFKKVK